MPAELSTRCDAPADSTQMPHSLGDRYSLDFRVRDILRPSVRLHVLLSYVASYILKKEQYDLNLKNTFMYHMKVPMHQERAEEHTDVTLAGVISI